MGDLFVTGPTTSSFDSRLQDRSGTVRCHTFYPRVGASSGFGVRQRRQLYVAASLAGKRGIVKIAPDGKASLQVAGSNLVGLAFAPGRSVVLATTGEVHHLSWDIQGLPLATPGSRVVSSCLLPISFTLYSVNAEIIAIGSEMLTPFRQDTNSLHLTEKLNDLGVEVAFKTIVGTIANTSLRPLCSRSAGRM